MITKRTGLLLLLGTSALCAAAIVPNTVDDGRHPWKALIEEAKDAADGVRKALTPAKDLEPTQTASLPPQEQEAARVAQAQQGARETEEKQAHAAQLANEKMKALGYDPAGVEDALIAYRADNLAVGDEVASHIKDSVVRAALEWVALRGIPQKIGLERLQTFARTYPDWPTPTWLQTQMEARILRIQDPKAVQAYFAAKPAISPLGKYALAKALKDDGRADEGAKIARAIFRDADLSGYLEGKLKADFGTDITKADYKYRADRLIYKEQTGTAMRFAQQAGADVVALERARAAVNAEAPSDKAMAAVPEALRKDPGLILAEVQRLRRSDKLLEAANLMQTAPRDPAQLIDGDDWWVERRVLARKLLDAGKINSAYVICATHPKASIDSNIEAEFHAGWIALRFMNEPTRAAYHFAVAAKLADGPSSIARIAYWRARTTENLNTPDALQKAEGYYRKAAEHPSTYYGQLARQTLGIASDPVKTPTAEAAGDDRIAAVRVVELLFAAGEKESATTLAIEASKNLTDHKQAVALASVIAHQQDAHLSLVVGKLLCQRGVPADQLAFPTFGIPAYEAIENSAPPAVVYSIARQESAFMPAVISKAGAKGLMQMIDATARSTATKAGLPFDAGRMITDASFNARLGAAHLGELLTAQRGSYILTFAAYNAGGGRVKQWIDAYGDPRTPGVDPVDWVERIPFTETRNYVQRVMANVGMYDALFAAHGKSAMKIDHEAKL